MADADDNRTLAFQIAEICDSSDDDEVINRLLYSSSSSDSDDEELHERNLVAILNGATRGELHLRPRLQLYVENVTRYSAEEFKSHFRMYPATFDFILNLVEPLISTTPNASGRKPIPAKKQLLLILWSVATPDSYRSVCEKFDVGKATAVRCMRRVTHALHQLAPRFIQWPKEERALAVMREFERSSGFPKIIGAIDGTHIKINAPKEDAQSYINRKSYHSIQVQAVCTHDLLFTSVFAGNVGSVHDARVFRLSPVMQYLQNPDQYFPNDSHLVGDNAYGLHQHMMIPFRENGHLSQRQKNFNFSLSSARVSIERAFALWKGRWRSIFDCLPMKTVEKIPEYLLASCVLHNICILQNDLVHIDNGQLEDNALHENRARMWPCKEAAYYEQPGNENCLTVGRV